jgi:hypothetical protein
METKQRDVEKEFKQIRNRVRNETRKLRSKEQQVVAQSCKTNQKKFWKFIKEKTNSKNLLGDIKVTCDDGQVHTITNDVDKCKKFGDYFSKVYTCEPKEDFKRLEIAAPTSVLPDLFIDEADILNRLNKLKIDKSPGPDLLHPRILKELSVEIASALKYLFTLSLATGELPLDWKCSFIIVLHKKGSKYDMSNYRPISLTCVLCKVFESIIRDHIMNYLLCNNFFSSRQFGFIKGRSTVLQLLKIMDIWTSQLESGGQIDVIYTDFERAFDKVPHQRLLSKLRS